jgi:hypothetical protein
MKPDPAAENDFIADNLARADWQGDACAKVAIMAFELGVIWPVDANAGRVASLISNALIALEHSKKENAAAGDTYAAGVAVGAVVETHRALQARQKGTAARKSNQKKDTNAFYAVACRLVASGRTVEIAYSTAKDLLKVHSDRFKLREFATPSLTVFRTELWRRRKRGV